MVVVSAIVISAKRNNVLTNDRLFNVAWDGTTMLVPPPPSPPLPAIPIDDDDDDDDDVVVVCCNEPNNDVCRNKEPVTSNVAACHEKSKGVVLDGIAAVPTEGGTTYPDVFGCRWTRTTTIPTTATTNPNGAAHSAK